MRVSFNMLLATWIQSQSILTRVDLYITPGFGMFQSPSLMLSRYFEKLVPLEGCYHPQFPSELPIRIATKETMQSE